MSKFITVVFPTEAKAYDGTRAFKELHSEGSLTVYSMAVIAMESNGKLSVKQAADEGPLGTGVGVLVGGLTGMLAGPVGAAVGMSTGGLMGGMSDIFNSGVRSDFVTAVSEKLTPGKYAVIAEADEDWVTPVDTRMEALGGVVIREWRSDFEDVQIQREIDSRKADLAQLKSEFKSAKEDRKAKLKSQIDQAQAKLNAASDRAQGRMQKIQQEAQAKTKHLQDQAAKATGDAKTQINQHMAELREDSDRRNRNLKQAWESTKAAFTA
jgi:uncharacterized membrane protein